MNVGASRIPKNTAHTQQMYRYTIRYLKYTSQMMSVISWAYYGSPLSLSLCILVFMFICVYRYIYIYVHIPTIKTLEA